MAKKLELLDIAAHYELTTVNVHVKTENKKYLVQFLVDNEILDSSALPLVLVTQTGLQMRELQIQKQIEFEKLRAEQEKLKIDMEVKERERQYNLRMTELEMQNMTVKRQPLDSGAHFDVTKPAGLTFLRSKPQTCVKECYANITQSSMKKVSVVDAATHTDPITILDSAVQSNATNTNRKTEELQKEKGKTNTTNKSQTKTPIEEEKGLKKSHHGDDMKRLEETTTERKTSKKSIISTYERTNTIKI